MRCVLFHIVILVDWLVWLLESRISFVVSCHSSLIFRYRPVEVLPSKSLVIYYIRRLSNHMFKVGHFS
jgi:hypothetical protein